jgi:hypothetical protein
MFSRELHSDDGSFKQFSAYGIGDAPGVGSIGPLYDEMQEKDVKREATRHAPGFGIFHHRL